MGNAGFKGRMLSGTVKGKNMRAGLRATIVSSNGLILTVSFHPISFGSGRYMNPSHPTRLSSCTSKK